MTSGMTVVTNLDNIDTMLKKRGLEPSGRVQKLLTDEVARYMDKYVPMQQGILKNTRIIEEDSITFIQPYSRYHYYGKLMVGRAPKELTDKDMTYHGAPTRGPFWDRRMWQDKGSIIMDKIAKAAGGKAEK
ncbi:MAG TPA: minor capsid protein [Syntrophomonas sp.]|nr:minor capsid protein [Syntrophomonas sp.]